MSNSIDVTDASSKLNSGWSDVELTAAVAAYLNMLRKELAGAPYNKAQENRALRDGLLNARKESAIEFRMQNISATLFDMRMPRILGYLPAKNVGSRVKERIKLALEMHDLEDLRNYVPTADPLELETRVTSLLRQPLGMIPRGEVNPLKMTALSTRYMRDPAVKAWVLAEANGACEGCDLPAPFLGGDGLPYLEVHHVLPLASYGSDRISNAAALCPNCHRRCHLSTDRDEFKLALYERISRLQIEVPEPADLSHVDFIENLPEI